MAKASEELLESLHNAVAEDLLDKVKSGEATAQELSAAIKFLKDNGIEASRASSPNLDKLAQTALPTFEDEDNEFVRTEGSSGRTLQ
jgi:hypothetical protein